MGVLRRALQLQRRAARARCSVAWFARGAIVEYGGLREQKEPIAKTDRQSRQKHKEQTNKPGQQRSRAERGATGEQAGKQKLSHAQSIKDRLEKPRGRWAGSVGWIAEAREEELF